MLVVAEPQLADLRRPPPQLVEHLLVVEIVERARAAIATGRTQELASTFQPVQAVTAGRD